jgi:hypothetical protein
MAKGCKFSLYELKFIGISNRNRVPSNRTIFEFRSDKEKYSISSRRFKAEKEMLLCETALVILVQVMK